LVLCFVFIRYLFNFNKVTYSKDSIALLKKYFGEKDFSQNNTTLDLKEKLDIKASVNTFYKSSKDIIDNVKHKKEIFEKHNSQSNKSYSDFTTLKITANAVIDYCIKKDINAKGSIKLLYLTFSDPYLQELFDEEQTEKEIIDSFYNLSVGFMQRYNKRISE
jgi:hypothetical protein